MFCDLMLSGWKGRMVMVVFRILLMFIVASLVGCATPKQWSAIGGSRSDGTVRLALPFTHKYNDIILAS